MSIKARQSLDGMHGIWMLKHPNFACTLDCGLNSNWTLMEKSVLRSDVIWGIAALYLLALKLCFVFVTNIQERIGVKSDPYRILIATSSLESTLPFSITFIFLPIWNYASTFIRVFSLSSENTEYSWNCLMEYLMNAS